MAKKQLTARNRISSSNLFLMELIVALLLFAVSSAACVSIFMKAHLMSEEAALLSTATDQISAAAELIRGCDTIHEIEAVFLEEYPEAGFEEAASGEDTYFSALSFLDESGSSCRKEQGKTLLSFEGTLSASLLKGELLMRKAAGEGGLEGEVICKLPLTHYIKGE